MSEKDGLTRKEFLTSFGKSLLGVSLCGVAAQADAAAPGKPADPLPWRLERVGTLQPAMEKIHGVAYDAKDGLYVAGTAGVKLFDAQNALLRTFSTSEAAVCVAVDAEGFVYAGLRTQIEKFDPAGNRIKAWGERGDGPGQLRYVTGIAAGERFVYVTDSGARKVFRFAVDGDFIDELAGPPDGAEKGFNIPSAYFDCKLDERGDLYVGHTGRHRIERYDSNNTLVGQWGRFGGDREGFCGCCNPTNIALFGDGRVATSEKGVPRLKVYDAAGKLLACLDEGAFPGNAAGMALAVNSKGRIALAEPVSKTIQFYQLRPNKTA